MVINGLSPGEVSPVHEVAPLKGAGIARKTQSEDMALGNVTNVDDVWGRLRDGAVHDSVNYAICPERFFGDGAGVGLCVRAKDEHGKNYEAFQNRCLLISRLRQGSLVTTSSWGCSFTNSHSARSAKSLQAK